MVVLKVWGSPEAAPRIFISHCIKTGAEAMKQIIKVPHSEIKAKLNAEKKAKKRPKSEREKK